MNNNDRCIAHLSSGGLLLTPDLRQARILRRLHDQAQLAAGRAAWPTAQVMPLDTWLATHWQGASCDRPELPSLLSPAALRWLWQRQVERDTPALLDAADLGTQGRASWLKLRAHGADLAAVARWPITRDQQAFLGWATQVECELHDRGRCDAGDLARLIVACGALPPPGPPILLAGFRRETPAETALFTALAASGHELSRLAPGERHGSCRRYRAADPESERSAMLAWLAARVRTATTGLHAVIVPDLDANRGALERALAAALQPELELPGGQDAYRLFDIAGGDPLHAQPVVDAALIAIACAAGSVDWAESSRLLLSPHLADLRAEEGARVAADLAMRDGYGPASLPASRLASVATRAAATGFAAALRGAVVALDAPRRRAAADWAEAFGAALAAWRWPGRALGSREYQAAQRFRELLRELASLSSVAPSLDARQAITELRRLAAAPFQPESGEPAVFVLDVRDDPGIDLDSLWVAGLTASTWPRPVTVDPLLPIGIQRELAMPHATPEDCVADAREVIACWRLRAGELVLSWPQVENDTAADASQLLPADATVLVLPAASPTRERLAFEARRFEPIVELPVPRPPAAQAPGGAQILELQALCPFRAFGELRLAAAPLAEPQAGFDRRLRGIALHRALQEVWGELGDRSALASLEGAARAALVEAAIDAALDAVAPPGMGERTIVIERDWQRRSIGRLLALDLARPQFSVVERERELPVSVGGLELRLRVDRVDRVGDDLVVIDYKSGAAKASAWRGARMDAPQLPLYAVLHPDRPTGIAFAIVGAARARHVGIGRDGDAIPGMQPAEKFALTEEKEKGFDWPGITAHWRAWLERLAADFASGRTDVNPKLGADTCRLCHLGPLCRVEAGAPGADEEEGADEE